MRRTIATFCLGVCTSTACADPSAVAQCLSCHLTSDGALNIVGIRALSALPEEWPYLFEDAFDLDGDGIAGRMRFVSGVEGPISAKFGQTLAAGRFEDFAALAGAAHAVDLTQPGTMQEIRQTFEALSPDPTVPFLNKAEERVFEARGCAGCHVTHTFEFEGEVLMPMSDFLLHETSDGFRRSTPLWGCRSCIFDAAHDWLSQTKTPN